MTSISNMLIYLGLALILFSFAYPFVTVVITTPSKPVIHSTVLTNGKTYTKLGRITACVSYADSVVCIIDGQQYYLRKLPIRPLTIASDGLEGENKYVVWAADVNIDSIGTHSFEFIATNKYGTSRSSGSFEIYRELTGTWYINDIEITSSDQVIELETTTLTFKFIPAAGQPISCIVTYSGPESGTLSLTEENGIWVATKTFLDGTYCMDLTATDGKATVTMTIIEADIGGGSSNWFTMQNILCIAGVFLVVYGLYQRRRGRS